MRKAAAPPPGLAHRPLAVDPRTQRLRGVRYVPSPNHDARPHGEISLLVVHAIALPPGEYGGPHVARLFTNTLDHGAHPYFAGLRDLKVSAHLFIRRDGSMIQFVPFDRRAWHAGASRFEGRERCNDFSIGIELEGGDDAPFRAGQYRSLARAVRAILAAYPAVTPARIVGHSDIAPGRKTDPGPHFDWNRLLFALGPVPREAA